LSRVPFKSRLLYHWDSVNFANGLRHFDVLQEHPQPPGYIVYVWLSRLVNWLIQDSNATMVWISIVGSSLAVTTLYLLGRAMWDRKTGLVAALFLASSPLFWFYGEIALPHTLDTLLMLLSVWLLFRVWQGEEQDLWLVVLVMAVAGGIRQQTLIFLLPLALYAVKGVGWKRLLLAGLLGAVVCLVWFVPLATSCGGTRAYLTKTATYSARFLESTSILMGAGWMGVASNLRKLAIYVLYGLGAAIIPLGIFVVRGFVGRRWLEDRGLVVFLGLWILPALLFYSLIHMGQQGLVFVFLPALFLTSAIGLTNLPGTRQIRVAILAMFVLVNTAIFCIVPEYPLGPGAQRLLTRDTVVNSDRYYDSRLTAIREGFSPESTVILAAHWDHVRYYLPEYNVLEFIAAHGWGEDVGQAGDSSDGEFSLRQEGLTILLFDPILIPYNDTPEATRTLLLRNGEEMTYFVLMNEQIFYRRFGSFGVR
jgi:hypothetical protein